MDDRPASTLPHSFCSSLGQEEFPFKNGVQKPVVFFLCQFEEWFRLEDSCIADENVQALRTLSPPGLQGPFRLMVFRYLQQRPGPCQGPRRLLSPRHSNFASSRPLRTTDAPWETRRLAVSLPMPELPPVTIATFPLKCTETSLSVVKLLFNDQRVVSRRILFLLARVKFLIL